jgi:hypothetical protein
MTLKLTAAAAAALALTMAPAAFAEDAPAAAAAPAAAPAPADQPAPAAAPAEAAQPGPAAAPAPEAAPVPAPAAEAPPKPVDLNGFIMPPPAGKGQVVFFRKGGLMGAAIVYKVREGTTAYGTLSPGRYFVAAFEPGKHTFVVHSEAKDEMTLEVDAGETYFVEGTVAMGVMVGRPNLTPSSQVVFDAVSKKLKLAKPEPAPTVAAN